MIGQPAAFPPVCQQIGAEDEEVFERRFPETQQAAGFDRRQQAERGGAVRALDVRDFDAENASLTFRHRPESDTPLKKGVDTERTVALPQATVDAIQAYITAERFDVYDDEGRRPLLTSQNGRPGTDTIRNWSYQATQPCLYRDCPHGRQRASCEWTQASKASQCPSSRAPTAVKTGAITRMLNRGVDRDRIRYRAQTEQWENYDAASENERLEARDRGVVDEIDLDNEGDQ
jgi:hypothetical protein